MNDLQARMRTLIDYEHIMTIAVSGSGHPWAAPVYYVFSGKSFWFFSSPKSRHILEACPAGQAAVTIYACSSAWKDIRGVQMDGAIHIAGPDRESVVAFRDYLQRFSFISAMLPQALEQTGIKGMETAFKARWYRFDAQNIYYSDNELGFGFREKVDL